MDHDSVLELLTAAGKPLKEPDILKLAKSSGASVSKSELANQLNELVATGKLFLMSGSTKTAPAYTTKTPVELARTTLSAQTDKLTVPVLPAKLRPKLPPALRPYFDEALGSLLEAGRLHYIPKGTSRLVMNRPPRPTDALTPANLTALKAMLTRASRFSPHALTLEGLMSWLDGSAASAAPGVTSLHPACAPPSLSDFQAWYAEARKQTSSRMVSVLDTWRHFQAWAAQKGLLPKPEDFREAMARLYDQGLIFLEPPERPQDLQKEEQLLLVPQKLGPPALRWCWTSAIS